MISILQSSSSLVLFYELFKNHRILVLAIEGRDGTGNGKRPARPGPVRSRTGREFLTGRYTCTGQGFWVFTYFARKLVIKVSFKIHKFFLCARDYFFYRTFIKLLYSVSVHHEINATLHQLTSTSRFFLKTR
jgi:hypothetical protein